MSDAHAARHREVSTGLRHLEHIEAEIARHRQNAFYVRVAALALVGGFIALHGAQAQPRYMFVAPMLAVGMWFLDAHAEHGVWALRWLAAAVRGEVTPCPPPMSVDVGPFAERVSWLGVLLRPARVLFFLPLTLLGAYIAVDAPRIDPDGVPSELFWYFAITSLGFLVLVGMAWAWWLERFGSSASVATPVATVSPSLSDAPNAFPVSPASLDAPSAHPASPATFDAPSAFPGSSASLDAPSPSVASQDPRRAHTNPFGTAVG